MKGFLLIDKEKGETSFDVVRKLRKLTGVKRIGHAGTLDPLATGLLVVAIGEGTKLLEYFVGCDKDYEVLAHFGYVSDSYDADGVISELSLSVSFDRASIEEAISNNFIGEILQKPPIYSALKIQGKKACDLARKGQEVELKSRKVRIDSFELMQIDWPFVKFKVSCQSGTYIRSLIHDLGQILGCGAYVQELRRTRVGNFIVQNSISLSSVDDIQLSLLPLELVVSGFERVELNDSEYAKLANGALIVSKKIEQEIAMAFYNGKLVGVLESKGDAVKFKKQIVL